MHSFKGVQKNMMKAQSFTGIKLGQRCFDNSLQTFSEQILLRQGTGQIFLIAVLIVGFSIDS